MSKIDEYIKKKSEDKKWLKGYEKECKKLDKEVYKESQESLKKSNQN